MELVVTSFPSGASGTEHHRSDYGVWGERTVVVWPGAVAVSLYVSLLLQHSTRLPSFCPAIQLRANCETSGSKVTPVSSESSDVERVLAGRPARTDWLTDWFRLWAGGPHLTSPLLAAWAGLGRSGREIINTQTVRLPVVTLEMVIYPLTLSISPSLSLSLHLLSG